jgi:branched-chain amino acid transport system permease protein
MGESRLTGTRSPARAEFRGVGLGGTALAVLLPLLVGPRDYFLYIGTMALVFSLLAQSRSLPAQAGLLSFGHAAFFGVGAYASALLSLRFHLSPWIALPAALLWPQPPDSWREVVGDLTGPTSPGHTGAGGDPACRGLNWTSSPKGPGAWWAFRACRGSGLTGRRPGGLADDGLLRGLLLLAAMCGSSAWIQQAPLGLALQAVRQGEARAAASGVDARRVKRVALGVSGLFAGGAGALHAHIFHWVDPASAFSLNLSVLPLIMAMFGGSGYLLGPVLGAVLLYLVNELIFQRLAPGGHLWLYGGAMIVVILALPRGILGWIEAWTGERRGSV